MQRKKLSYWTNWAFLKALELLLAVGPPPPPPPLFFPPLKTSKFNLYVRKQTLHVLIMAQRLRGALNYKVAFIKLIEFMTYCT